MAIRSLRTAKNYGLPHQCAHWFAMTCVYFGVMLPSLNNHLPQIFFDAIGNAVHILHGIDGGNLGLIVAAVGNAP